MQAEEVVLNNLNEVEIKEVKTEPVVKDIVEAKRKRDVKTGKAAKEDIQAVLGRPAINLKKQSLCFDDPETIGNLAAIGATVPLIANLFGMKHGTVKDILQTTGAKSHRTDLAAAYKSGRAWLKMNLHQAQIISALVYRNPLLLIWLGKQYLEQHDRVDHTVEGEIKGEIRGIEDFVRFLKEAKDELRVERLATREPKVIEGKVVDDTISHDNKEVGGSTIKSESE